MRPRREEKREMYPSSPASDRDPGSKRGPPPHSAALLDRQSIVSETFGLPPKKLSGTLATIILGASRTVCSSSVGKRLKKDQRAGPRQVAPGLAWQHCVYEACGVAGCSGCLCHDYDHIVPYSKGGKSTLENCQVLQAVIWTFWNCQPMAMYVLDKIPEDVASNDKSKKEYLLIVVKLIFRCSDGDR